MKRLVRAALGAALCAALCAATPVMADERPAYRLQIVPYRLDLEELKPGQTTVTTFEVQNTGAEAFEYSLGVEPYSIQDADYTKDYGKETQYTDIAGWVKLSTYKGRLEPGAVTQVTVTVHVPKDVPAGGQYAAILAQLEVPDETSATGVTVTKRVGLLLFSNVQGETRFGGNVVENNVPSIFFAPPIAAMSLIENTGNIHVEAEYVLQVFPLFSDEEIYTNEENPETRTILPDTKRFNTVTWAGAPRLGIFRVRQTVKMLDKSSVTEKLVLVCPMWFLFIIILLIFCVIFWAVSRGRRRRKEEKEENE